MASAKTEEKKKTGRPRIEIDQSIFEELCRILCTEEEIAGVFRCSVDTIERWVGRTYPKKKNEDGKLVPVTFAETKKRFSADGKSSLRRAQYKLAMSGNATMLIWLGRNWLNQTDKQVPDTDTEDTEDYFEEAGV